MRTGPATQEAAREAFNFTAGGVGSSPSGVRGFHRGDQVPRMMKVGPDWKPMVEPGSGREGDKFHQRWNLIGPWRGTASTFGGTWPVGLRIFFGESNFNYAGASSGQGGGPLDRKSVV